MGGLARRGRGAAGVQGWRCCSLLTAAERQQAIHEWNDSDTEIGLDCRLDELFEAAAERRPEAVALVCQDGARLVSASCRAAPTGWPRGSGRGVPAPETLVAVYLERGAEMVVAVLGILRAGAAYVPLSESFPAERRRFILEAMGIEHMVSQAALAGEAGEPKHLLLLPEPEGSPAPAPGLARRGGPDDLAYIIFTSGSTGTPKGVMVQHRPAVNLVRWVNAHLHGGSR